MSGPLGLYGDELEPGYSAGALGEGGVDERLGGGSSANDESMTGSAGDKSVAEAGKTAVFLHLPGFEAYRVVFKLIFMCYLIRY